MLLSEKKLSLIHIYRWNGDKAYGFVEKHAPAKMEDMI